jgi:transcriptional regulator with XRE-family HTH domain
MNALTSGFGKIRRKTARAARKTKKLITTAAPAETPVTAEAAPAAPAPAPLYTQADAEAVFRWFREISKIPRGSGNTKGISDYIAAFAVCQEIRVYFSNFYKMHKALVGTFVFFNRFKALCEERDISVYRACTDIGLNRSAVAKWKDGGKPNGTTAGKLAEYFGVTTDYLLGQSDERRPARKTVSDEDIKFALFGGDGDITDEMYDEVKRFARFIKEREGQK